MNKYKIWDRCDGREDGGGCATIEASSLEDAVLKYADLYEDYVSNGSFRLIVRNLSDGSIVGASAHPVWRFGGEEPLSDFELARLK